MGELLSAIERDANDQMYPICWAMAEGESYENWIWFLKLLVLDLGLDDPLSQEQDGLYSQMNKRYV